MILMASERRHHILIRHCLARLVSPLRAEAQPKRRVADRAAPLVNLRLPTERRQRRLNWRLQRDMRDETSFNIPLVAP